MSGFAAPNILFLNSWSKTEREFMQTLTRKLYLTDRYNIAAEPWAGGFPTSGMYATAGWTTDRIQASSDNLFSAAVGTCMAQGDPGALGVRLWGDLLPMTGDLFLDTATILYEQALARMECKPKVIYWDEIVYDLKTRRDDHVQILIGFLRKMHERLAGIDFTIETIWQHMRRLSGDPKALMVINPPSYAGGYERFFNTGGKVCWDAEPQVEVWEPKRDQPALVQESQDWAATLLTLQLAPIGECAHERPIYAHSKRRGFNDYIWSNKPDLIEEVAGLTSRARSTQIPKPIEHPIIAPDYEITEDSNCTIMKLRSSEARYYKDLWIHKLDYAQASGEFAVLVDGYMAGISGLLHSPLENYDDPGTVTLMMLYAVGPFHQTYRLTRLVKMLALDRGVLEHTIFPWFVASATRIMTKNWTQHPEAKGQRGIMTLAERKPHPQYGYELIYVAPIVDRTIEETFEEWLKKEKQWLASQGGGAASRRQRPNSRPSRPTTAVPTLAQPKSKSRSRQRASAGSS